MKQEYVVRPVGFVRSGYREASLKLEGEDLELDEEVLRGTKTGKGSISTIVIDEAYADCLDGIEGFSHILVLFWAHEVDDERRYSAKVHPAGRKDYPLVGVFATRSPARPNPICATTVELVERRGNVLQVRNLDALDGSPVIDIKFHHPSYDAPPDVAWPDWMERLIEYFRTQVN